MENKLDRETLRLAAKQMGKKGGRPRTVEHKVDGYCRCAECRGKRKETGYVEKKEADEEFDFGA